MDTSDSYCTAGCYRSNCIRLGSGDCKRPHYSLTKLRSNISEPAVMVYERASLLMDDSNENMLTNKRSSFIAECNNSKFVSPNIFSSSQHNFNLNRSLSEIPAIDNNSSPSSTSLLSSGKLYRRNSQFSSLPSCCMEKMSSLQKKKLDFENPNHNPKFVVFMLLVVILVWSTIANTTVEYLSYFKTRIATFFINLEVTNNNLKSILQKRKPPKKMIVWSPVTVIFGIVFFIIQTIIYVHEVLSKPVPLAVTELFDFYKLFK